MGIKLNDFKINGFDISQFNGVIDWDKVKTNFIAIRVGYGNTIDSKFVENINNAQKKDIGVAYYWYMDYYNNHIATSSVNGMSDSDWGKKQAENCWNAIKGYKSGMVFIDVESTNGTYAPKIEAVQNRVQTIMGAFLSRMDELNNLVNGIYCSLGILNWHYSKYRNRPLWVAWYPYRTATVGTSDIISLCSKKGWQIPPIIWQYASDGDIDDNGTEDGKSMGMQYEFLDLNGWVGTDAQYKSMFEASVEIPNDEVPIEDVNTIITKWKITANPSLFIRQGSNTSYKKLGLYYPTDIPVQISTIENGWGKLNGQDAYISLAYAKKVS
jgi:GH25 family lysozyme M1 (1,4-beta-N-acetylmuramidase)